MGKLRHLHGALALASIAALALGIAMREAPRERAHERLERERESPLADEFWAWRVT
jgi:hypothetical protein